MLDKGRFAALTLALTLPVATVSLAGAQAAASPVAVAAGPSVKEMAPDFSLPGADKYGLLRNPVRLSDFRGRTVVLAFFYQARTKG